MIERFRFDKKENDNMLKIKEAMEELNVSASWMDKMISLNLIKIVWFGGVRRVPEEEIERIKREGVKIQ